MTVPAVLDSTCFIALERIERLELLPSLFDPIYAPPEVIDELGSSPVWLLVKEVGNRSLLKALSGQLDFGEAAAIALAVELGNLVVILDDKKARRVGRQMGLKCDRNGRVAAQGKARGKGSGGEVASRWSRSRQLPDIERASTRSAPTGRRSVIAVRGKRRRIQTVLPLAHRLSLRENDDAIAGGEDRRRLEVQFIMRVATGKVIDGKVVVEGEPLVEGSTVTVFLPEREEEIELTPEEEARLAQAIQEADDGDFLEEDAEQFLESC